MSTHLLGICTLLTSLAVELPAAAPAGSISGPGIEISGVRLPAAGVPSWPLSVNDDVRVHTGMAFITLRDGSKLLLAPGTRVVLSGSGKTAGVRLLAGQAYFHLSPGALSAVAGLSHAPVPPDITEGVLTVQQERVSLALPLALGAAQPAAAARNYAVTVTPIRITPANLSLAGFVLAQEIAPAGAQPQLPPATPGLATPVSPSRPAGGAPVITIP